MDYPSSKSVNINLRVKKKKKKEADKLFKNLGLNTSTAINMFLTQCVRDQEIPFNASMNNSKKRLLSALEEVKLIEAGKIKAKKYNNFDEIIKDLDL